MRCCLINKLWLAPWHHPGNGCVQPVADDFRIGIGQATGDAEGPALETGFHFGTMSAIIAIGRDGTGLDIGVFGLGHEAGDVEG